jgi:hypothetical protein
VTLGPYGFYWFELMENEPSTHADHTDGLNP